MGMSIRDIVKQLLEDEFLIVKYNEYDNGGYDLSVRLNERLIEKREQVCCMPEEKDQEND